MPSEFLIGNPSFPDDEKSPLPHNYDVLQERLYSRITSILLMLNTNPNLSVFRIHIPAVRIAEDCCPSRAFIGVGDDSWRKTRL
jgi:hypothetical protein